MRLHRFYVTQPLGEEVVINDVSLIKQWANVFRYKKEDLVILFNGDGNDITFSIQTLNQKQCELQRIKLIPSYIPHKKVTLYLSCIKKDNFELVTQKATELGVTSIVPIISERSEKKNINEERLLKIAIESAEQCGRGDIPVISEIVSLATALEGLSQNKGVSFVLQMGGKSIQDKEIQEWIKGSDSISLFVGPEGGWSTQEEELFAKHGVTLISLGNTVLRAETAGIVACAFCTY